MHERVCDGGAWKFFESLAPSYKRMYLTWIDSAKRDLTKQTRLQQAVKMLSAGRKPSLG
jgi:uncharacterized protein YdeI (YjbR/CyaY-like superfamily)